MCGLIAFSKFTGMKSFFSSPQIYQDTPACASPFNYSQKTLSISLSKGSQQIVQEVFALIEVLTLVIPLTLPSFLLIK